MKVAIFGAGTMGSGIAQVFAAKGHTALMYASSPASAQKHKDKLAASLAKRVAKGKMTQEAVDALLANILVEEKSACADADLIIECVKEDMATKKELLSELDGICKDDAIFATNTSSLSITEMGLGLNLSLIHIWSAARTASWSAALSATRPAPSTLTGTSSCPPSLWAVSYTQLHDKVDRTLLKRNNVSPSLFHPKESSTH